MYLLDAHVSGMENRSAMSPRKVITLLPYSWVFAASCCGAWFHWQFFPEIVDGTTRFIGDIAMFPGGFRLLMNVGTMMYLLPVVNFLLAIASLRIPCLQRPSVISFVASLIAGIYLFYAFLLSTPLLMNAVPRIR